MPEQLNKKSMLPMGTVLAGRYRIDRYLSSGGFGNTYVATNVTLGSTVAIKEFFLNEMTNRDGDGMSVQVSNPVNQPLFEQQLAKFNTEARRISGIRNAHVVGVHDLFEENGTAYYVMDYIDGESLAERMKQRGAPLSENEVRAYLPQVLDALQAVHDAGIYHLDLKPANIMVDKSGQVRLIDFGASKQEDSGGGARASTLVCFTEGYAPIEQCDQNMKKFGPWTGLYALGATLYSLLSNNCPPKPTDLFDDTTPYKTQALPLPPTVSQQMHNLILWLMQFSCEQRPQSVQAVVNYLDITAPGMLSAAAPAPPVAPAAPVVSPMAVGDEATRYSAPQEPEPQPYYEEPVPEQSSNKKILLGALAGVLLLGAVGAGVWMMKSRDAKPDDQEVAVADSTSQTAVTGTIAMAGQPQNAAEQPAAATSDAKKEEKAPEAKKDEAKANKDAGTTTYGAEPKKEVKKPQDDNIYSSADQMPSFPGGEGAMMRYLSSHVRYPGAAQENNIQGRVVVQFVVKRNGEVGQVKVVRSVDPDLDREAVRVVKSMPKFNPGRKDGQPVNVWYTLPVTFKLGS